MIGNIVCKWLRWRYGGNVFALAPPIGWSPWGHTTVAYKIRYYLKRAVWRCEVISFKRYGQSMRDAWTDSTLGINTKKLI